MMRIVGIVQARTGSTRLPGKVLRRLGRETVLGRVVRAARASDRLDGLVVATTEEPDDDAVVAECAGLGVPVHRGPVDDVLTRFLGALDRHPADAVMRFTADCPLLDPQIAALAADVFRGVDGLDYLSTVLPRTLPRGMDVEIIGASALKDLDGVASGFHRTHVTSYVYTHPDSYRLLGLTFPPPADHLRVTLDTLEDWELITRVVAEFGERLVPLRELVGWLDAHPEVRELNAAVEQKALAEG
jgi:spore coat polysaccharide biosynthesis protein SpsF